MMAELLEIARRGNPILRQSAREVEDWEEVAFQKLVDRLMATAVTLEGVGIAAPQASISQRLFIVASRPNSRYPNAPEMEPTAIINPKILSRSDRLVKDWEGCLSVPGWRGVVPRSDEISVEYRDRAGQLRRQVFSGFVARIFQHELDHLNGILFIDRLESQEDLYPEAEYQQLMENSNSANRSD